MTKTSFLNKQDDKQVDLSKDCFSIKILVLFASLIWEIFPLDYAFNCGFSLWECLYDVYINLDLIGVFELFLLVKLICLHCYKYEVSKLLIYLL